MALFGPARVRLEPRIVCPDSCYGMLGCQCPQYERRHEPEPRVKPAEVRCWIHGSHCGTECKGLVPYEQRANRAMPSLDPEYRNSIPETDHAGREVGDPLFGLPHLRCSCAACAQWRAANAHKLGHDRV